jgi:hypothetical protein
MLGQPAALLHTGHVAGKPTVHARLAAESEATASALAQLRERRRKPA